MSGDRQLLKEPRKWLTIYRITNREQAGGSFMTLQFIAEVLCEQLTLDIKVDTVNVQRAMQTMRRRFRPYRTDEAVMVLRVPKSSSE